jgi:hypothetical protein
VCGRRAMCSRGCFPPGWAAPGAADGRSCVLSCTSFEKGRRKLVAMNTEAERPPAEGRFLLYRRWLSICSSLLAMAEGVAGLYHVLWGVLVGWVLQVLLLRHCERLSQVEAHEEAVQAVWREQLDQLFWIMCTGIILAVMLATK